jgi:hypothetical protein
MIFNSHGPCKGVTLFRFFQLRVELWMIPSYYNIEEHTHPAEDVELIHLFGRSIFYRRNLNDMLVENRPVPAFSWFKKFTVKHYHSHWFSINSTPMFFINIQRFLPGCQPKSAAEDFSTL